MIHAANKRVRTFAVVDIAHETDIEILRQVAVLQKHENERLHQRLRTLCVLLAKANGDDGVLQRELLQMQEQLARCQHMMFGRSSERRPHVSPQHQPPPPRRGHGSRKQLALPTVERLHEMDPPDLACPSCRGTLAPWTNQFEESEEIDVVQSYVVTKHKRQKYRCKCGGAVDTAPGPLKLRPGNRYSIDFAIASAVAKYLDHLPLERQVRMMGRQGLEIDSQTLWDQIEMLARLLGGVPARIRAYLLLQHVLCADETPWRMLVKGEDGEKSWYVWSLCGADAAHFQIHDTRSTEAARALVGEFDGVLVTDGYKPYDKLKREGGRYVHANCWAHVRREFLAAEKFYPREARAVVDLIDELFRIERLSGCGPPGDPARLEMIRRLRAERSGPVLRALQEWGMEIPRGFLPKSGLAKAAAYMTGLWPGLNRFLEDPTVPLSSNAVERSLRGVVVGRKNFYGTKSRRGAEVAALFYTLFESAKLCGLNPTVYIRAAAHAALRDEPVPMPHEIAAQQKASPVTAEATNSAAPGSPQT